MLKQSRRALFVLPSDTLSGAERVCASLAESAARSGEFDGVDLYVFNRPPSGSLDEIRRTPGLTITYAGVNREAAGLAPLARFLLERRRYALTFSTLVHINAYLCLLRRLGVLRTDRLVTREATDVFRPEAGYPRILKYGALFYGNQDLIICQTGRMAESLELRTRGRLKSRTRVMSNFIDLDRVNRQRVTECSLIDHIPRSATKIIWCGRLDSPKRPERAIKVLAELRRGAMPDAHLVMVGDGRLRPLVEDEIAKSGVGDAVTLCGYQSNPIALMTRCDLGLLTSDAEGFPNVILEMVAAGVRTVVTTDCAGDLGAVPHVEICKSNDPAQLAAALVSANRRFQRAPSPEQLMQRSIPGYFDMVRTA